MKRTTVFLPDELHERLRKEAFRAKTSMAELIRVKLSGISNAGLPNSRQRTTPS